LDLEFRWEPKTVRTKSKKGGYASLFEAILNSGQSCNERRLLKENEYIPKIEIIFNQADHQVIISDNGMGIAKSSIPRVYDRIGVIVPQSNYVRNKGDFRGYGFLDILCAYEYIEIISHNIKDELGNKFSFDLLNNKVKSSDVNLGDNRGTAIYFNYKEFMNSVGDDIAVEKILNKINPFHGSIEISIQRVNKRIIGKKYPTNILNTLIKSINNMERNGDITDFLAFLKEENYCLSNRDLMGLDEKHFKFKLLSVFHVHSNYTVISEQEVDDGYIDILLKKKLNSHSNVKFEWLIELKYVKQSDIKKLKQIRAEGIDQASKYAQSRIINESIEKSTLKVLVITFLGKSNVYIDFINL
jgi:hypothetical protein